MVKPKIYGAIDGLRTIAAIGVVMMHIAVNTNYEISGYLYSRVIPSFTNFTFLFMVISSFGMCCGYYEKVRHNQISFDDFYGKRFKKIFPFFAVLVILDIFISPSLDALYEGFADLTLLYGLLPNAGNISVIGVGWFLGLIFVFYLCFPFFCCLIRTKKRAWVVFAIGLFYNFVCANYFDVGRSNILYSGCFFLAGGLVYLYREELEQLAENTTVKWMTFLCVILSVFVYYLVGGNIFTYLMVSSILLIYAVISRGGSTTKQIYTLHQWYQYGDISFSHGHLSCG